TTIIPPNSPNAPPYAPAVAGEFPTSAMQWLNMPFAAPKIVPASIPHNSRTPSDGFQVVLGRIMGASLSDSRSASAESSLNSSSCMESPSATKVNCVQKCHGLQDRRSQLVWLSAWELFPISSP